METDGSIYFDRGYKMVNFVTVIPTLAKDVMEIINKIDFEARIYKIKSPHQDRYNIRIAKNVECFLKATKLIKN